MKQQTQINESFNNLTTGNGSPYDRKRIGTIKRPKAKGKFGGGLQEIEDCSKSNTHSKNSPRITNNGGFRLTAQATNYDYAHRPFEDKHIR